MSTRPSISKFCIKYSYSQTQVRYAIDNGNLERISRGTIDEDLALQAPTKIIPAQASAQSNNHEIITALQAEIQSLKDELQNILDLKNYYEVELNKLGIFPPQKLNVSTNSEPSMKKLSGHPILSQEWLKDQFKPVPESEKIVKSRKVQIPQEAFFAKRK